MWRGSGVHHDWISLGCIATLKHKKYLISKQTCTTLFALSLDTCLSRGVRDKLLQRPVYSSWLNANGCSKEHNKCPDQTPGISRLDGWTVYPLSVPGQLYQAQTSVRPLQDGSPAASTDDLRRFEPVDNWTDIFITVTGESSDQPPYSLHSCCHYKISVKPNLVK